VSIAEQIIQDKINEMIADYSLEEVLQAFSQWCEDDANENTHDEYWMGVMIHMRDELHAMALVVRPDAKELPDE